MYWASRPKIRNPRKRSRKNKKTCTQFVQALTSHHPRQTNPKPDPRLLQCERKVGQSRDREGAVSAPARSVATRNVGTSEVQQESCGQAAWRTSPDVPCRHSWRHVFAGIISKPVSPRVSRPLSDKNKQNPTKLATLSGSLTPAQPTPSTQTIENKNTKRGQ